MGVSSLSPGNRPIDLPTWKECCICSAAKPIPDNRENITIRLDDHIQSVQGKERYEDEMFIIKYFKKGSAHITFKRLELIDRINDIIARYFPSVLSA
ncbi:ybl125 [Escherichia coli]|uniref:Ybl125 n=1 Tax=Escherichia coli TaxID=562 RepID=A0A2X3K0M4_ECOLX|nr:ybl125 [Escherichia coli]